MLAAGHDNNYPDCKTTGTKVQAPFGAPVPATVKTNDRARHPTVPASRNNGPSVIHPRTGKPIKCFKVFTTAI
jgi:hypothetical protein